MALGFGFNKTKVLASAEKYVQQGKLQNAINEYLKVVKEDPKDLTVLNTIGDLYARLGKNDEAVQFFQRVGDQYAADGFVVKAIAMYKKLAKIKVGTTEYLLRLAELYTQQGLYNDARSNYMQVADAYMKASDLPNATRIFQRMLELDPENAAMQARLADLYCRTGKREEAKQIFLTAAQSLYMRGSLEAADEALAKVLDMEATNPVALALRGQIAVDLGKAPEAIAFLDRLADIDSRPEALHALLGARLLQNNTAEAEPVARKLLSVHNDISGVSAFAEALMNAGEFEPALGVYNEFADRLLANDAAATLEKLHGAIGRIKENVGALEILLHLYRRASETTHIGVVTELLAHACVQAGDLARARELFQALVEAEPENPLHAQHLRQIQVKLGEDVTARPLSPEVGAQAFMVDEIEISATTLDQQYPEPVAEAIKAALTDSELLDSYNLPQKAIPALEQALAQAPRDARLNQRLASLYVRAERFADAAACCELLAAVYAEAGLTSDARQYAEMAAKYRGAPAPAAAVFEVPVAAPSAPAPEFAVEVTPPAPPVAAPRAPAPAQQEIDLSEEWMAHETTAAPPAAAPAAAIGDLLDEARFYLAQGMPAEARAAYAHCVAAAPDNPDVIALAAEFEAAPPPAPAPAPEFEIPVATSAPSEFGLAEPSAQFAVAPPAFEVTAAPEIALEVPAPEPAPPPAPAKEVAAAASAQAAPADGGLGDFVLDLEESLGDDFKLGKAPAAPPPAVAAAAAPLPPPAPAPAPAVIAAAATPPAAVPAPAAPPAPAAAADAQSMLSDIFQEFKEDVEQGAQEEEDPDTHYNLGVAFKEMGLLDEAIGELQRVCQAVDRGKPFSQAVQAYTWLAACFVEKGVPQAAVRWYERALKAPGVDSETSLAIQYELGGAFEAAGDKKSALQQFMAVYSSNIDYRDVADRIKALKA